MNIRKRFCTYLIVMILCSLLFVAAIPTMIVALVNGNWYFGAPCIAICVLGFYGIPIGWAKFGEFVTKCRLTKMITQQKTTSIRTLAQTVGCKEKQMLGTVRVLIYKHFLVGYTISDDGSEIIPPSGKPRVGSIKCPACGANVPSDTNDCLYCGFRIS